jgi:hypothetical protein
LVLATEEHPDAIIDIATLTGACMTALGTGMAGVFGTSDTLVEQVKDYAIFGWGFTFRDIDHLEKFVASPVHAKMAEELRAKNGIRIVGTGTTATSAHTSVYVGYCSSYNNTGISSISSNSGSGILVCNTSGGTLERNTAHDNGVYGTANVGIWIAACNGITIQYNESYNNKTRSKDGGGFGIDGGCTNCILQYNYSHNNYGGGYGIFQFIDAAPFGNNVVRYNISENDAATFLQMPRRDLHSRSMSRRGSCTTGGLTWHSLSPTTATAVMEAAYPSTRPPTTTVGSRPPASSSVATIVVVVVLPWVPAIATQLFSRINSASISARRTTGMRCARAAISSGLSRLIAVETTTTSAPSIFSALWPTETFTPCSRSRPTVAA